MPSGEPKLADSALPGANGVHTPAQDVFGGRIVGVRDARLAHDSSIATFMRVIS
jgi:hypothetical protein